MSGVACVVIGRNEAPRLARCLASVLRQATAVVYVDSASTDDSVAIAERHGVPCLVLDTSQRLSAARGRNAGLSYLVQHDPALRYVQFVDGDSELADGWLEAGRAALDSDASVAVVCGQLREKNRDSSVYNALCDMEWARPAGDIESSGGIAMMRVSALQEVGGFDATLIAGEEPDLCARLRAKGERIQALGCPMGFHDAAMTHFSQWWLRNVRTGHAYGEALVRRPDDPAMRAGSQVRSVAFWGVALPALSTLLAPPTLGASLLLPLTGYPALALRVYRNTRQRGYSHRDAALYASFCVLGKFPQAFGLVRYELLRLRGQSSEIIEHRREP